MVNILPYNLLELRYTFLFSGHSLKAVLLLYYITINKLLPTSLTIIVRSINFLNTNMPRDIQVYLECSAVRPVKYTFNGSDLK